MGLIKAANSAVGGMFADQWKEFFYCESLDADTLAVKGKKRITARSRNLYGEDNIISDGSQIAISEGQCMIVAENGKILELCAEPGVYVYATGTTPSAFGTTILNGLEGMAREAAGRFGFGGMPGKDQRIYYLNVKEIVGNRYGTPSPIPFRIIDSDIGFDMDVGIRCNGEYSYKIVNPSLFYSNVCGNVAGVYTRDRIESQLRSELVSALQPAFARLSVQGIRYSALPGHVKEITDLLRDELSEDWLKKRGIQIVSFGMNSVAAAKEDEERLKQMQKLAALRNPEMAAAALTEAKADAMRMAASNAGGSMTGFLGMAMAAGSAGLGTQDSFLAGVGQKNEKSDAGSISSGSMNGSTKKKEWECACGTINSGKFCVECGSPRPSEERGWICENCGTVNQGKFCTECGSRKPPEAPLYRCDKCGWEPEDPYHPPKYCPECGDIFDENDICRTKGEGKKDV